MYWKSSKPRPKTSGLWQTCCKEYFAKGDYWRISPAISLFWKNATAHMEQMVT